MRNEDFVMVANGGWANFEPTLVAAQAQAARAALASSLELVGLLGKFRQDPIERGNLIGSKIAALAPKPVRLVPSEMLSLDNAC